MEGEAGIPAIRSAVTTSQHIVEAIVRSAEAEVLSIEEVFPGQNIWPPKIIGV